MVDISVFVGEDFSLPVLNLLIPALCTVLCLLYLRELVERMVSRSVVPAFIFGIANGVLTFCLMGMVVNGRPILAILFPPLLIVMELRLISKDQPFTYFYIFSAILTEFACLYSIAVCLVRFFPIGRGLYNGNIILLVAGILVIFVLACMMKSRHFPTRELRTMFHSRERGMPLLISLLASNVVLLVTAEVTILTLLQGHLSDLRWEQTLYLDIFLRVGLILIYNHIIIMMQSRNERHYQKEKELNRHLWNELEFRRHTQKTAMVSYVANVSQGCLTEGEERFSERFLRQTGGCYSALLREFARRCVHPDDQKRLFDIGRPGYYEEKIENDPSYFLRFRISPVYFMEVANLPDDIKEKLLKGHREWVWIQFYCTITREWASGEIFAYVSLTDVDEQVTQEEAMYTAANTDALTGLFNRSALERRIQEYLMKPEATGAFIIVDLDYFKQVNDALGHPEGDQLLQDVVGMLRSIFRGNDLIGRMGGDEFCIFAVGLDDYDLIEQRVKELNRCGRKIHIAPDGREIQTSLSIGIAISPQAGRDYGTLYRNADAALYEAKRAGRNTYHFFDPKQQKRQNL